MRQAALVLTDAQRQEVVQLRDTAPKPYLRERAAAILKVASGLPVARVARERLLRPRQRDTVHTWLRRFRAEGIAGLHIRPGRGRKPAFSPSASRPGQRPPRAAPRGAP